MLETVLIVAGAVLVAVIGVLKVVAPRTATHKDDEVLALLEKVLPYLPAGSTVKADVVEAKAEIVDAKDAKASK